MPAFLWRLAQSLQTGCCSLGPVYVDSPPFLSAQIVLAIFSAYSGMALFLHAPPTGKFSHAAYDVVLVARLVFRLAASLPLTPRVRYHAIIGNNTRDVPFGHSVQEHPHAIVEIRCILHRQLEQPAFVRP
jgi:hypothetical protein